MRIQSNGVSSTAQDLCQAGGDHRPGPVGRFEHEVERAGALVDEAIARLSRRPPEHAACGDAWEALQGLRPHFEGALAALTEIEQHRGLTYKELSCRRAFKMLLEAARTQ